jgi:uncharacterized protein DUF417
VLRYGLVLVIGWVGLMKFTGYEAKGIEPLVAHSQFMGWMYRFLSVQTFSDALGVVEVTIKSKPGSPSARGNPSSPKRSACQDNQGNIRCSLPVRDAQTPAENSQTASNQGSVGHGLDRTQIPKIKRSTDYADYTDLRG